jgi:lipopolysaccharide transport system ATP-binding protein
MRDATVITAKGIGKEYELGRSEAPIDRITERLAALFRGRARANDRRKIWALRDVSFEISRAEAVGVIGRNGAGKTTLLKILARITQPTKGTVELRGRVGALLEVGTGFHPDLTGRENVYLNGAILGMTRREVRTRFDEIVAFAGVSEFIDTPVKRYSSGMYVRLAFAVAAHLEPDILLVDEVLSVGDAAFQRRSIGRMEGAAMSGRTVVFVSHDLGAVQRLTSRCLYLANGEIAALGPTDEVIGQYLEDSGRDWEDVGESDLEAYRRPREADAPLSIQSVRALGATRGAVSLGDPVQLEIGLDVHRRVEAITVTVVVKDQTGRRAATLFSLDDGYALTSGPGNAVVTILAEDLHLSPGRCYVDVGVNAGTRGNAYDVVQDLPLMEIINDGRVVQWQDRPWGVVHPVGVRWDGPR